MRCGTSVGAAPAVNVPIPTQGEAMKKVLGYLRDEQGVETLEWIAVGALIVALALAVYPGTLKGGIDAVIADITTKLTNIPGL